MTYLTPKEIAAELKCGVGTIMRHIKRGELRAIRVGTGKERRLYRIERTALDDFLASKATSKRAKPEVKVVKNYFPEYVK